MLLRRCSSEGTSRKISMKQEGCSDISTSSTSPSSPETCLQVRWCLEDFPDVSSIFLDYYVFQLFFLLYAFYIVHTMSDKVWSLNRSYEWKLTLLALVRRSGG